MENLKRHILGSRSAGMSTTSEPRSVFHIGSSEDTLNQDMRDCYQGIEEFRSAMRNLDGAGTHLTESLAQALRGTDYQKVGEQLAGGFREVYGSQQMQHSLEQLKDMESMLLSLETRCKAGQEDPKLVYAQTTCHILLLFAKLQKQYFQICHQRMAELLNHLLVAKDPEHSAEVTKFILKLGLAEELSSYDKAITSLPSSPWSSPKLRKASQGSPKTQRLKIFSLFERKPLPEECRSAFYISSTESEEPKGLVGMETPSLTAGSLNTVSAMEGSLLASVPLVTMTDEMNNVSTPDISLGKYPRNQLVSEEELDSVISLLSGVTSLSPSPSPSAPPTPNSMHSIPEDPPRVHSPSTPNSMHSGPELRPARSPMQLTVPGMFRMPSPASDTQLEDLQLPKLQAQQVHRRSEGCLDLSGMGRSTWPNQQHRASLPTMQLFSAPRHHLELSLDPPAHPSNMFVHDPLTTSHRPPPGYLGMGGGGGLGVGGSLLTGSHWPPFGHSMEMRNSGTWPLYQPVGIPSGDLSSSNWLGFHEGSDGSDDSSNGDHFFAVGKDLAHAIDSRNDSSDDEKDLMRNTVTKEIHDQLRHTGCTNTWPLVQHMPGASSHYHPPAEFPDFLEPPSHRPLQMQWSDPMSAHSIWPASAPGMAQQKTSQSMHGFGHHS
ncbi:hypothetical protein C0Q70_18865 [Pomacea canaliculata]|uniref:Uncharacterized protein n=2 Tax=Pomacea canaliculata TaxID=400727 RepID=A0A2T7NHS6_POMCA|nr:hypothetical protein C0Q70_18865 [Pomacea canaliculata]